MARLALSPLLIAQALKVRRVAQRLPEAAGPRSGVLGSGPPLRLRIVGDSSAAGVGVRTQTEALSGQLAAALASQFTVSWQLDALSGATTKSTQMRLQHTAADPADIIVTALGVNDVTRLLPRRTWLRQQMALFDDLRARHNPRRIYLSGVPPMGAFPLLPQPLRWTLGRHAKAFETTMQRHAAKTADLTYVPFDLPADPGLMASDGFHPNAQLNTLWAKEMASRIITDWPKLKSGYQGQSRRTRPS
jgi:lysophospholipase L1-like esterase